MANRFVSDRGSDWEESDRMLKQMLPAADAIFLDVGEHLSPEKKLLLAVLTDAIYTYQSGKPDKRAYNDVIEWFADKDEYGGTFTFHGVCSRLGLSPGYILKKIQFQEIKESA